MLHWFAASRAEHIPPAPHPARVLVDLACGGGLDGAARRAAGLPARRGRPRAARAAAGPRARACCRSGARCWPSRWPTGAPTSSSRARCSSTSSDDVAVLAECARLLRPGGTLVIDAVADTRLADLVAVAHRRADPRRTAAGAPRPRAVRRPRAAARRRRRARPRPPPGRACRPSVRDARRLAAAAAPRDRPHAAAARPPPSSSPDTAASDEAAARRDRARTVGA